MLRACGVAVMLGLTAVGAMAQKPQAKRVFVFLIDGLRPDQITEAKMPSLYHFKQQSTSYLHSHSTYPTVTRVNGSTISTGTWPEVHGIVSNSMDLPMFSTKPMNTGSEADLVQMATLQGDHILLKTSMSELLTKAGKKFVVVSSGSTGGATLMAPEARHGVATVINGSLDKGARVAYPDAVDAAVKAKFGQVESDKGVPSVVWAEKVLREYAIPELKPDVLFDWITEPDSSQHRYGIGSPEALKALKIVDENFGEMLKLLEQRGELATTDILVTADHGFGSQMETSLSLKKVLDKAGLASTDLGILNDGQTSSLFLREKDAAKKSEQINKLAAALLEQPETAAVFTRAGGVGCKAGAVKGVAPGTIALEKIHLCRANGADVVVATGWNDAPNQFGEPGKNAFVSMNGNAGGPGATHGGFSEWTVHTPLILHGPDFEPGKELNLPSANIDIPPTLMFLMGVPFPQAQGRALRESMKGAMTTMVMPQEKKVVVGGSVLKTTTYGGEEYLDRVVKIEGKK